METKSRGGRYSGCLEKGLGWKPAHTGGPILTPLSLSAPPTEAAHASGGQVKVGLGLTQH